MNMKITLQNRIIAIVLLLLVVCMSVFSVLSYLSGLNTRKQLAMDEMRRTAAMIAAAHSRDGDPDWQQTDSYIRTILSMYAETSESELLELFYITATDSAGGLAAYRVNYGLARKYNIKLTDSSGTPLDERSYKSGSKISSLIESSVPDMNTIIMPVIVNGRDLGTIEIGYLVKRLAAAEKASAVTNIFFVALLCILGTIAGVYISRPIVKAVLSVSGAMKEVGRGNLDVSVTASGSEETRSLAQGLNSMAAALRRSRLEIENKTAALALSENKYRTLFQSAGDSILLLNSQGVCLDANEQAARLFNQPVSDLVNTFIFDLVTPSGAMRDFKSCPERWDGVVSVPDAKPREVETLLSGAGENTAIAVIRDMTPWREAEQAILEIKKRQQKLLEGLPVGIITLNPEMRVTACNLYMAELMGSTEGGIVGSGWKQHSHFILHPDLEQVIKDVLENGRETVVQDVTFEAGERDSRILEVRVGPFIEDPGQPHSVMLVAEDVTDKVEMKRIHDELQQRMLQSQKLEAIGTLAGGIAHDFNNMLAVIMGNIQTAMDGMKPDSSESGDLSDARKAAVRARNLTRKLLSFARKDKPDERVFRINPLVEEMLDFAKRSLSIDVRIDRDLCPENPCIKADTNQVFQALLNICNNAGDSMPGRGVLKLETRLIQDDEVRFGPGKFCLIRISDTGSGIPERYVNRIFDPFFTTKPPGAGTGLGLSVTLGIIENHGGQMSVSSKTGEGTVFEVFLPCTDEPPQPDEDGPVSSGRQGSETILAVDDEDMICNILKKFLSRAGYNVMVAHSGKEALEIMGRKDTHVDLALIDMAMPEMTGADTCRAMRQAGIDIPVIVMSGYIRDREQASTVKEHGATGFVEKPFDQEVLYSRIREALESSKKTGDGD